MSGGEPCRVRGMGDAGGDSDRSPKRRTPVASSSFSWTGRQAARSSGSSADEPPPPSLLPDTGHFPSPLEGFVALLETERTTLLCRPVDIRPGTREVEEVPLGGPSIPSCRCPIRSEEA